MRRYYELVDDVFINGRWYLNGLYDNREIAFDSRNFTYGLRVHAGPPLRISLWNEDKIVDVQQPLRVPLRRPGRALDITYADHDMPVVTAKVADIISEIAKDDVQRFPVVVDNREAPYEIINVTSLIDCIDHDSSRIQYFEKDNPVRPDLAGQPEMITKLVIDPTRVGEHHIFRPEGWEVVTIVSERLKVALEEAQVTGVEFQEVSA